MKSLLLILLLVRSSGEHVDSMPLFNQINEYRVENGLPALIYLSSRQKETDKMSEYITRQYQHGRRQDFYENITKSYSLNGLFNSWKNSSAHNTVMLEPKIKYATVSIYHYGDKYYAVFRGYIENKKVRV